MQILITLKPNRLNDSSVNGKMMSFSFDPARVVLTTDTVKVVLLRMAPAMRLI
jgi:hypothetical protein